MDMAEGMRVIRAEDLGPGGAFHFGVTSDDEIWKEASEHFVEKQAEAWWQLRQWADDQMAVVEMEPGGSPNGPGASLPLTENLRAELPKLWERHQVRSVLDVACGDWNWMRYVNMSNIRDYYGWDVDPELIKRCQEHYDKLMSPLRPFAHFEVRNVATTNFPNVDCILARHILIHFPNDYIVAILDKMKASGAKYLLTSNFPQDTNDFVYDPTGYAWMGYMERPLNLETPPFSLSNKIEAIPEQTGPAGVLTSPHELALFKLDPGPGHFPLPVITPA
jgi:SAM-dependent methyltransferase